MKLGSDRANEVINTIVKRMETILMTPESILCQQDEELSPENDFIYFISKGKCKVTIKDKFTDRYEEKEVRILEPGMHFGVSHKLIFIHNFLF